MRLYRDSLFALQIHVVEYLRLHLAVVERTRKLQKPVCQCTFTVIDVRDNAKIADVLHFPLV